MDNRRPVVHSAFFQVYYNHYDYFYCEEEEKMTMTMKMENDADRNEIVSLSPSNSVLGTFSFLSSTARGRR